MNNFKKAELNETLVYEISTEDPGCLEFLEPSSSSHSVSCIFPTSFQSFGLLYFVFVTHKAHGQRQCHLLRGSVAAC